LNHFRRKSEIFKILKTYVEIESAIKKKTTAKKPKTDQPPHLLGGLKIPLCIVRRISELDNGKEEISD